MKKIILSLAFVSSLALAQAPEVQPTPVGEKHEAAEQMGTVTPPTPEQKANVEKPVKAAHKKAAKHVKHAKKAKKTKKTKKHKTT